MSFASRRYTRHATPRPLAPFGLAAAASAIVVSLACGQTTPVASPPLGPRLPTPQPQSPTTAPSQNPAPTTESPSESNGSNPAAKPKPEPIPSDPIAAIDLVNALLVRGYQGNPLPIAERTTIRVQSLDAISAVQSERQSVIIFEASPQSIATDTSPATRTFRAMLGRITLIGEEQHTASGERATATLRAVSRSNNSAYFEKVTSGTLDVFLTSDELPPLLIPQLRLVFASVSPLDTLNKLIRGSAFTVDAQASTDAAVLARNGSATLTVDRVSGRLRMLDWTAPSHQGSLRFTITNESCEATPQTQWLPPIDGRKSVATLSELRPTPPEIPVGARLPALGLMGADLVPWDMADPAATTPATIESARTVLVLYVPTDPSSLKDAATVERAAVAVREDWARRRAVAGEAVAKVTVKAVGMVEPEQLRTDRLKQFESEWTAALPAKSSAAVASIPAWSAAGSSMLSRFALRSKCAAIVIDGNNRILACAPMDGCSGDGPGVVVEMEELLTTPPQTP